MSSSSRTGILAPFRAATIASHGAWPSVHQVLVCPLVTFAPEGEAMDSIEQYATAAPLNAAALEWFASYYLSDPSEASDPQVSPLNADDLSGLPPRSSRRRSTRSRAREHAMPRHSKTLESM